MKKQKTVVYSNFRGVDLSSSLLSLKSQHASYMQNWTLENGILKKRNGSRELYRFKERINGCWALKEDNTTRLVVHSGRELFVKIDEEFVKLALPTMSQDFIVDERSFGVEKNGKLYIFCGDYLVYCKRIVGGAEVWELRRVYSDIDTYIPTTTISIDNDLVTNDTNRHVFEDINLLTPRRKNLMVGIADTATYTVDSGKIKPNTTVTVNITSGTASNIIEHSYTNSSNDYSVLKDSTGANCGLVVFASGKVTITKNFLPIMANDSNIEIGFEADYPDTADSNEVNSSKVTRCVIGSLFGDNGNADRIFISGNPSFPSMDYYSEADDFTYFGDMNYTGLGTDSSSIGGYSRLNDGTQAVTKCSTLNNESSIYFRYTDREPVFIDKFDNDGVYIGQKQIGERTIFPIKAGPTGITVASKYGNASLVGDNLFVSSNGVYSIQMAQNIAVAERIALQRSKNVSSVLSKLSKADLASAVACVFKDKYYLSVSGKCYIADTNYWADEQNYEWWIWDNIHARIWLQHGDSLMYGTEDGRIIELGSAGYKDITYESGGIGGVDYSSSELFVSGTYEVKDGYTCVISGAETYQLALTGVTAFGDIFTATNQQVRYGWKVLVHEFISTEDGRGSIGKNTEYTITDLSRDGSKATFKLQDSSGENVSGIGTLSLVRLINARRLKIAEAKRVMVGELFNNVFKLEEFGEIIQLVKYGNTTSPIRNIQFEFAKPVQAEWLSGITDLSAPYMAKTLTDLYCTPEAISDGKWDIGYKTYSGLERIEVQGTGLFDFNNIDFNKFSFNASNFPQGYHVKIMERDKNFVQFVLRSLDASGAAINNFGVKFTVNREIKGVE